MIELEGVPELVDPVMVAAFEGWNDAGDAASAAVAHLDREWKGEVFAALDAEDYYDFQVNRPTVWLDGGVRKITWPTTRLSVVRVGGESPRDLVLVRGIEPSMRWRSFCNEILGFAHELGVEMLVILGSLLGDTPHTRPVPVSGVTSDPDLARTMDLEETRYEGPTGIVGILQEACTHAGVPAVSLWAAVPHYVSQPPNPKATLALLNRLEDLLNLRIPLGELSEDARAWQLGVDQLAAEDSEVAEYVQSLEEARDTAELPEASGEAIAREFERYLRRRDPQAGPGGAAEGQIADGRDGSYLRDTSSGRTRPSKATSKDAKDGKDGKDGGRDGKGPHDSRESRDARDVPEASADAADGGPEGTAEPQEQAAEPKGTRKPRGAAREPRKSGGHPRGKDSGGTDGSDGPRDAAEE
ncbi:PAC2 family protein [Streptomyces sp. MST-110588]|uniref:PAC2 family protein n=1 Tax=Streptomyces sp. MST-110588 TaxID=2833628 RepID=UPI001F5CE917|nr:PAC2 family protein [Streptomyces sp. MST-110588]UNO43710.1 PAC2 family protein [Streptomyces sp. MST-110588]